MVQIKHDRPKLKIVDAKKNSISRKNRLLDEIKVQNQRDKYVANIANARASYGPAVLRDLLDTIEGLICSQDETLLITMVSAEVQADRALLVSIINKTLDGMELSLDRNGSIKFTRTCTTLKLTADFIFFKNVSIKNKGFRSKECRNLL
jgi:hypothetical protein